MNGGFHAYLRSKCRGNIGKAQLYRPGGRGASRNLVAENLDRGKVLHRILFLILRLRSRLEHMKRAQHEHRENYYNNIDKDVAAGFSPGIYFFHRIVVNIFHYIMLRARQEQASTGKKLRNVIWFV